MALTADQVQKFYIGYYARPADPVGLAYWETQDEAAALKGFSESAEFTNQYQGLSASQQVTKVYNNLLGRAPDTAGLLYWAGELTAGRETIGSLVLSMIKNALGKDVTTIEDRVTYSTAFTTALNTAEEINAYSGQTAAQAARDALLKVVATAVGDHTALDAEVKNIDATIATIVAGGGGAPGQNFTLTVNADTATAHIFDAPIFTSTQTGNQIQTLTSVDKLTGTAATDDALNAILNATEVTTKPTMSGVEKVNLTAIAASIFDAANSTGITEIGSIDSNANLTVRNLAAGAAVVVKNTAAGASTQVQFANAAAAGTSDVATIKVDGVGRGATAGNTQILNVRGETAGSFETLNIESTGGASRFANIGSDATVAVNVAPAAATSLVKTINVTGTANLRVDNALLNVTTLDANAFEGNLRVALDATKNVTVTGGKGADYFDFVAGLSNLDTVNGGDGRDTIAVTTNAGLGDGNKVTNVEILRNDGAAGGTIFDLAKVASFDAVVHNSALAATYNNFVKAGAADAAKGLTILGVGNVTVGVKDANALGSNSDVLYVNVGTAQNAAAFAAGTVTTAAIEKIVVDVKDAGANTATAGAQPFVNADAAIGTVEFKGGSLGVAFNAGAIGGSGVGLTKIDGSAFVGNLTTAGNAFAQVILGGSGNDVLSTGGRAAFAAGTVADTLTGGAGGDNFRFITSNDVTADSILTNANLTTIDLPANVAATNRGEIATITDLNLGGANAGTRVDTISFAEQTATAATLADAVAAGNVIVVNGGGVTAMTGANLGAAVNALVNAGILEAGAGNAAFGLFTWGGDTYLIGAEGTTAANNFGAAAGADIIIKVTGVTGTLDVSDFIV